MYNEIFAAIRRRVGAAVGDFRLLAEGDRVLVAVSGGKDSLTLLHVLEQLRRRAPVSYELIAVTVDAGFPGFRREVLTAYLREQGFTHHLEPTEIASIIAAKLRPDSSYCAFCSRLRRGVLYAVADRLGCNKIALGHHLDDAIETLLLNQFYIGRLAAMSPKMLADNGRHTVIRPLIAVEETMIAAAAEAAELPVIRCGCPVEGVWDRNRQRMKQLVTELARDNPTVRRSLLRAMGNVQPRYLLDRRLPSG